MFVPVTRNLQPRQKQPRLDEFEKGYPFGDKPAWSLNDINTNSKNIQCRYGIVKKKFTIPKKENIKNQMQKCKGLFGEKMQCLSIKQKLAKRISGEKDKIKQFKQKLQQIACRDHNTLKENIYRTATSSPYILRQKKRKKAIESQQLQSRQQSLLNLEPNLILDGQKRDIEKMEPSKQKDKQKIENRWDQKIKQGNDLSVWGLTPKWRQFESWKRLRYKITIKGYRGKVDIRRIVC